MKIGIVVHTVTGYTLKFAQAVKEKLIAGGHEVDLLGLRTVGKVGMIFKTNFTIKSPPELDEYDAVIVGSPVWGFKATPVVMRYLIEDVKKLKGKKALAFVTMDVMGGNRALSKMNEELETAGADVLEGEAIGYFAKKNPKKNTKYGEAVDRVCNRILGNG